MRQSKILLVTCFLLGSSLWLLSFGWGHVQTARRLEQNSTKTEGRVVSSATRPLSKGGQSYSVVVEYLPASHPAITKEFDVDSTDYKAAQDTGKATVTYVPEEPQVSRVTKFAVLPFQVLIGLGGVMLLAGLFCLSHVVKSGRRQ